MAEIKTELEERVLPEKTELPGADVVKALQDKLLGTSGVVTSDDGELETLIKESITETKKAGEAREIGLKAGFERQRIETQEAGERKLTSELEARRGFATNTGLIRQIEETVEKSLKDLDLREQQALAMGSMEEAETLRGLRTQQLQFKQQSQQQAVANLLSLAGVQAQQSQIQLQQSQLRLGIASEEARQSETLERISIDRARLSIEREKLGLEKDRFLSVDEIIALRDRGVEVDPGTKLSEVPTDELVGRPTPIKDIETRHKLITDMTASKKPSLESIANVIIRSGGDVNEVLADLRSLPDIKITKITREIGGEKKVVFRVAKEPGIFGIEREMGIIDPETGLIQDTQK